MLGVRTCIGCCAIKGIWAWKVLLTLHQADIQRLHGPQREHCYTLAVKMALSAEAVQIAAKTLNRVECSKARSLGQHLVSSVLASVCARPPHAAGREAHGPSALRVQRRAHGRLRTGE
jgi:hypothetical protein